MRTNSEGLCIWFHRLFNGDRYMKLDHLRYFDRLAEMLSYTNAAKSLYIAQPTLSAAIKRMEQEVGLTLFRRAEGVASRVELTEQGRIFHEYVTQALECYDTGLNLALESQNESDNLLRLGTVYSMKGRFWSNAIDDFISQWGSLPHFHMEQAYSAELANQLKSRGIDVAFAAMTPEAKGLNHIHVWSQSLVACVNVKSPLAKKESITIEELKNERLLTYSAKSSVSASIDELLKDYKDELNMVRSFDDELSLSSFVSSHSTDVALMVYSILVNAFDDVVCIPIADAPADFHKIYLMSRDEAHSKIVGDFIDFMSEYDFPDVLSEARTA